MKYIHSLRAERSAKRQFEEFLRTESNMALKDNINNLPRPEKSTLRILCTSDSMRQQVKTLGDEADYMVVNSFVMDEAYVRLKPKYYVIADPNFYIVCLDAWKKINTDTKWPMTLFVPWSHINMRTLNMEGNVTVLNVNAETYSKEGKEREWAIEHNLAMPPVYNVLNMALYVAICLGYKIVELYGAEHSWLKSLVVGEDNKVYWRDSHFYDKEVVKFTEVKRANGTSIKLHEMMFEYYQVFKSHWELRALAEKNHCRIINMTPNSYIDAYDRGVRKK